MYVVDAAQDLNELADALPNPAGYQILVQIPEVEEKTKGGVFLPQDLADREKTASIVGLVVKKGVDAYRDPDKFPNGPWCEVGQYVFFKSYAGARFKFRGKEYRLLNDDSVNGVTNSLQDIERV